MEAHTTETNHDFMSTYGSILKHEFRRFALYETVYTIGAVLLILTEIACISIAAITNQVAMLLVSVFFGVFALSVAFSMLIVRFCHGHGSESWRLYSNFVSTKLLACETSDQMKTRIREIRNNHFFGENSTAIDFYHATTRDEAKTACLKRKELCDFEHTRRIEAIKHSTLLLPDLVSIVGEYDDSAPRRV